MKTVLYVNGKIAVWVCFERNLAVNVHVESLQVSQAEYQPCAWLFERRHSVYVVLDTEQSVIDAFPIQRTGSIMSHRSNTRALHEKLIRQYPDAVIRMPARKSGLDALMVQRLELDETMQQWLGFVEASQIVFSSIVTGSELLADMFGSYDKPYLVVSNIMGYHKHTFCRAGHALFVRTFEQIESESLAAGLAETLAHLASAELVSSPVRVCSIGFAEEQLAPLVELEWVLETVLFEDRKTSQIHTAQKCADEMVEYNSAIQIAKHAIANPVLGRTHSGRHCTLVCAKHVQLVKQRRKRQLLAAFATLTFVSIGVCGSKQWDKHQQFNRYSAAKASLTEEIEQTHQQVLAESPAGLVLAQSLLDTVSIHAGVGISPAVLLVVVADAFTTHRELILQELSWTSVEVDDVASQYKHEVRQLVGATSREHVPQDGDTPSKLIVKISGYSVAGKTLRDQQDAVNDLVASFEQQAAISEMVVLETPLEQAASQQRVNADVSESGFLFRIQFEIDRVVTDAV